MMATQQKEFLIRVAADIKNAQAQLAALGKDLDTLGAAGSGAAAVGLKETKKAADDADRSVGQLAATVVRFAAAIGAFRLAREFVAMNLEFQAIQATLEAATGSAAAAASEYAFITREANRLGLSIAALALPYAKMIAASKDTVLEGQATRDIFIGVAEAGAVLKWSAAQSERAMRAFEQMMSKTVLGTEELKLQLGDILPGAMTKAARAMGVTSDEFLRMIANGEILTSDFLPKFIAEMDKGFGPGVEKSVTGLAAAFGRLKTAMFGIVSDVGEAGASSGLTKITNWITETVDGFRELFAVIREGKFDPDLSLNDMAKNWQFRSQSGAMPINDLIEEGMFKPQGTPTAPQGPSPEDILKANNALMQLAQTYELQAIAARDGEAGVLAFKLALMQLNGASEENVDKVFAMYNATVKQREANEQNTKAVKAAEDAARLLLQQVAEGQRIFESVRTPMEALTAEIDRLDASFARGHISVETYGRAMAKAFDAMEGAKEKTAEMDAEAKKFASTMEGAFSTLFFDVLDGKFENMAENFSRALKRMVAEMLASRLFTALGGVSAGGATPTVPAGGAGVTPVASLGGGHAARATGLTAPKPLALSSDAGGGGNVTVVIENKGTPQGAQQGRASFDARGMVVSIVTDDLRSGGPIATTMERTYNARRKV